jgi:hypothetical protein
MVLMKKAASDLPDTQGHASMTVTGTVFRQSHRALDCASTQAAPT